LRRGRFRGAADPVRAETGAAFLIRRAWRWWLGAPPLSIHDAPERTSTLRPAPRSQRPPPAREEARLDAGPNREPLHELRQTGLPDDLSENLPEPHRRGPWSQKDSRKNTPEGSCT
jgi:hypothetical protein